jgi:hypothetical protein
VDSCSSGFQGREVSGSKSDSCGSGRSSTGCVVVRPTGRQNPDDSDRTTTYDWVPSTGGDCIRRDSVTSKCFYELNSVALVRKGTTPIEINGRGDPLRWPRDTLYPQNLALTSPTCGGGSVGIVPFKWFTIVFKSSTSRSWVRTSIKSTRKLIKRYGCRRHTFFGKFVFDKAPAEMKTRECWVSPVLSERNTLGEFHHLHEEL